MHRVLAFTGYAAATFLAAALLVAGVGAAVAGGSLWLRIPLIAGGAVVALYVARARRANPADALDDDAWPDGDAPAPTEFDRMVEAAVAALPADIRAQMSNVAIVVEDEPPDGAPYLGLYRGYPLTMRSVWQSGAAPDKISIYRGPLERLYGGDRERLVDEVNHVVRHEVAHHFGISDERLIELDRY
jgi:predicted Zn-dependent protease with MMP-like domain